MIMRFCVKTIKTEIINERSLKAKTNIVKSFFFTFTCLTARLYTFGIRNRKANILFDIDNMILMNKQWALQLLDY